VQYIVDVHIIYVTFYYCGATSVSYSLLIRLVYVIIHQVGGRHYFVIVIYNVYSIEQR